jgi:hypothetical protein
MEKAKRARKAETPRQPSLCLRLRAPYLYPDPTATVQTVPGLKHSVAEVVDRCGSLGWMCF